MKTVGAWTADEPLRELSLHGDWDSVASMVESLRIHLFEYGTVPTWNFLFCGGRPEMAVPFSWAYTWPSLFAYVFEPNEAIVAVWIVMSAIGFVASAKLFERWTGSRRGAWFGAGIYVFCGVFSTAFYRGHVTWAFYHLVPVLMLLFERCLARERPTGRGLAAMVLVSFLFFTSGLPHALIHFYPALIVLVLFRAVALVRLGPPRPALRTLAWVLGAHGLGLWLAAYKIWPALAWQMARSRPRTATEAFGLAGAVEQTLKWNPTEPFVALAYLGPGVWALGAFALLRVAASGFRRDPVPRAGRLFVLGVLLPVSMAGLLLAMGNADPLFPGYWLKGLPIFREMRGYSRYLILTAFGLSGLVAFAIAWIGDGDRSSRARAALATALGLAALLPVVVHAAAMLRPLPALRIADIQRAYTLPEGRSAPWLVVTKPRKNPDLQRVPPPGHAVAVLQGGGWIANCRSDLAIPHTFLAPTERPLFLSPATGRTRRPAGSAVPLSEPPPIAITSLGHDRIVLEYAPGRSGGIDLNLGVLEGFEFDAETVKRGSGLVRIPSGRLEGDRLSITARYDGPAAGRWASLAGVGATVLFFAGLRRAR